MVNITKNTINPDTVIQKSIRGGGLNVNGLSGKGAVEANEIYNNMIEKKSIAVSVLQDPQRLKALGKDLEGHINGYDKQWKLDPRCIAKLADAVELLKSRKNDDVSRGLLILEDVLVVASGHFNGWGDGDPYLVSSKAEAELREVLRELYLKRDSILQKANKILVKAGKRPISYGLREPESDYYIARSFEMDMKKLGITDAEIGIVGLAAASIQKLCDAVTATSADTAGN